MGTASSRRDALVRSPCKRTTNNEAVYTCVTAWADVNNDGKLDLFVAQFAQKLPFVAACLPANP